MERDYECDQNNDQGEYDLIPGDNDYPSDEQYAPDAPANLVRIPAQGISPQGDTGDLCEIPVVKPKSG